MPQVMENVNIPLMDRATNRANGCTVSTFTMQKKKNIPEILCNCLTRCIQHKTTVMKKFIMLLLPVVFLVSAFHHETSRIVRGIVTDQSGKPVPFASVLIKGTSTGVQTDVNGQYSIRVSNENAVLVFSAISFENVEEKVSGRSVVNVTMVAKSNSLQEVIVTSAFSTKRTLRSTSTSFLSGKVAGIQLNTVSQGSTYAFSNNADGMNTMNTESYDNIVENSFLKATDNPLSTFSIDVDGASYSNVRRMLNDGEIPPAGAVRVEEMINYFHYDYPQPTGDDPFSFTTEMSDCPWNRNHKLVLIGMQGKKIPVNDLPPSNLVFLVDVSGSMEDENKLPLVKSSLKMLTDQLREEDKISIVVYAGNAGLVLPATSGANKMKIKDAIDSLEAGGSTAGGEGIRLAYKTALENYKKHGNNRVILCTDGDFNVGMSSDDELERYISKEKESGVFLTVLGFGMGNYKDSKMQKLADKGNGNHAYIDGINEARKVLVNEFGGTLFTIAKDVKLQVEFNPMKVQGYRLVGYENRMLQKEDFNDDKKDAGDMGSGHTVTALYEIIPAGVQDTFLREVEKLRYQRSIEVFSNTAFGNEIMTIKFRYKEPQGTVSKLIEHPVADRQVAMEKASANLRFASAVAEFGMLLRESAFRSDASYQQVLELARAASGDDDGGYRAEFLKLVEKARSLSDAAAVNVKH